MNSLINRIAVSAGIFIGVLLIMCLAAKIMMNNDNPTGSQAYEESLEKLSGEDTKTYAGEVENPSAMEGAEENNAAESADRADDATDSAVAAIDAKEPDSSEADTKSADAKSKGHVVVIDAAHQLKADTGTEPIGPGASETRYKVTSGASGVATGVPEYKLNLAIALLLEDELKARGYEVYMVRTVDEVTISDSERASIANDKGEIVIHIHGNADDPEGIDGTMAYCPSKDNKFLSASLITECETLSKALLSGLNAETGADTWGVIKSDNLTALNWTKIPASHVEVGYLSNIAEDKLLQTEEYRKQIAVGLADGVDLYFGEE